MSKIDKSQLSKSEWHKLRELRRTEKELIKKEKLKESKKLAQALGTPSQKKNVPDEIPQTKVQKITKTNSAIISPVKSNGVAFVLGNGTSRSAIEPEWLRPYGKIYGCNALYRSFDPDYLIAVDVKMMLEINKAAYQQKNPNVWTNPNRSYSKFKGFNYFNPAKGWSSGPTALWLASQHTYETIYILGFDYRGLSEGQKVNNIYADTPNYKKSSDSATFFGNWLRQTASTMQKHTGINYVRVIAPDNYSPPELNKIENYSSITIDEFQIQFGFPPK